jgi:hypothetical protein
MATKTDSPTVRAGNVMWNAAVVANWKRDRSMKVMTSLVNSLGMFRERRLARRCERDDPAWACRSSYFEDV